jgi:hypothetical protein
MLGYLKLPVSGNQYFTVVGGPYLQKPIGVTGVKMAEELPFRDDGSMEIDIPTEDFSVPNKEKLLGGLESAIDRILTGELIYVGCMGGRGRTGLFLSILAKVFSVDDPVGYVRKHYYEHAVETHEQYQYVMTLRVPFRIRYKIWVIRFKAMFKPNGRMTRLFS